jgi:mono/diheme cytochrome c family protein
MSARSGMLAVSVIVAASLSIAPPFVGTAGAQAAKAAAAPSPAASRLIDRGRYLAMIGGCNDCHTPGYMEKAGKVPEKEWLVGDTFGWRGPWGTTYPVNLRLYMQTLTEEQWLKTAATLEARPPMPWYVLHQMTRGDLRALYRYIRYLGPAGEAAPAWVPPDKEPKPPYATFPAPPK